MASTDPILTALARLEPRLVARIDGRIQELFRDFKLDLDGRFDALHRRLDHLEIEYEMVKAGLARLEADVSWLKAEVGGLKADVAGLKVAVGRLEAEVALLKSAIARLEEEIPRDRADRQQLRNEIDVLRVRVTDLDERVRGLEARLPPA